METPFGASLRSSRIEDNQSAILDNVAEFSFSKSSSDASLSSEDHKRDLLLQLLKQITEFLEHKESKSSRLAATKEWRKSRSRRVESSNLFQVVIQVCEDRMSRLKRSTRQNNEMEKWSTQSPRILVAEAIVQELLVTLMGLKMKERENFVMNEEEKLNIMRQLHVHLQKDEKLIRHKVCAGAGDSQQLEELQLMLRTDFLEQARSLESPQKTQQVDSASNSDASLQFAWETIDDQKKEIIRLRAQNEELKRMDGEFDSSSSFQAFFFDDEPTKVIHLLRSQLLSQHHHKHLNYLQNHIQTLEKALQQARLSCKTRQDWDGSKSTVDSSQTSQMFSLRSRSAIRHDFTRTQISRKKCDECHKYCASLFALQSEITHLQTQVSTGEDLRLQAEKDREHFQHENSALSSALLSAKQKQEELRQTLVDLTQEKHKLQNVNDSEQRTLERSIRVLKEQLDVVEEQKGHLKRDFDELTRSFDAEVISKRTIARKLEDLQVTHTELAQSTSDMKNQMVKFDEAARRWEALVETKEVALNDMQAQIKSMERDGKAQVIELQEKESAMTDLNAQLSELRLSSKRSQVENDRIRSENERLLQILEESKRKNQRLEKGFDEMKQGKQLLTNIQQDERDALALETRELDEAQEQIKSLKLQLVSTKAECARLGDKLAEMTKSHESERNQRIHEVETTQNELETMKQRCLILEKQMQSKRESQRERETCKQENCEQRKDIHDKLAESTPSMLRWITKCDALSADKQKLENDVQSLLQERHGLQQLVFKLEAESKALIQQDNANTLALKNKISSLTEQHRTMERERRIMDQKKLSLVKLVQTLQARPELQRRAFREMLVTCQRGTERTFCLLFERVTATLNKLDTLEKQYKTLKINLTAQRSRTSCSMKRENDVSSDRNLCLVSTQTLPQIVLQDNDFLSNSHSGFSLSTSQPLWLEAMTTSNTNKKTTDTKLCDDHAAATVATLETNLKQYKWKYFVHCLVANCNLQEKTELVAQVTALKKSIHLSKWYKLKSHVEIRHLYLLNAFNRVVVRRLSKELKQSQQAQFLTTWKHETIISTYESKLRDRVHGPLRSPYPPSMTIAVANCIHLIRRFCDQRDTQVVTAPVHDSDDLTAYLMEICTQMARWKVAVERRIAEYVDQAHELKSVQTRCGELKDLVGLNQRLIEELERRSAGQSSVLEAAKSFALAYKALAPFARAQVFQSREFLSASKNIIESLNSMTLPRKKFSQTLGINHHFSTSINNVTLLSASAASASSSPMKITETSRKRLNDLNIELLEDAVGSLKGVMQKQRNLQVELRTKQQVVGFVTKKLYKCKVQFLLLRIFWRWKCATTVVNGCEVRRRIFEKESSDSCLYRRNTFSVADGIKRQVSTHVLQYRTKKMALACVTKRRKDLKFNVTRYMLRYVVGAATDELRAHQLQKVRKFRAMADDQIVGVIDDNFVNFNTSLARFTSISNQLRETREKVLEVHQRAADGKTILSSKTRNLRDLLLQKYEATKVVDVINDIERIEAAPRKINTLLQQEQFLEAVEEFARALELVFSQHLVAFQATARLRDELMECKQTIEDRLVHELQQTIYLNEAFTTIAARTNQYSRVAIENELCSQKDFDVEVEKVMHEHASSKTKQRPQNAVQYSAVAVAPLPTPSNTLQTAVRAIKKLHREREVIGTIKSSIEHELDAVIAKLSRLCRGIFNSTSTSFATVFTDATFGTHDDSKELATFLRLFFIVIRRIIQRHSLVATYFEVDGDSGDYRSFDVVTKISRVLERLLGEYLDCASSPQPAALHSTQPNSGQLFKLSRNKPPTGNQTSETQDDSLTKTRHCLVCEPSVFHLPEVYPELECMGDFLQPFLRTPSASPSKVHSPSSSPSLGFKAFLSTFTTQKWIPKIKAKAHEYLAMKARSISTKCRLPIPSDTSYQPPSIDSLFHVIENLRAMMIQMPPHAADLASVLEASVLSWLEECAVIVRDIREPTLNHRQLETKHVTYADLATMFHHYEGYQRAKQGSPIPYHHSKVQPAGPVTSSIKVNAEEVIAAKELEIESELYDVDSWMQFPTGLLMDNARIGMLGYANSACDLIALYLERIARGSADEITNHASTSPVVPPALMMALQAASWQCSALADECLLFLRREVRLHCCYYLTQLVSQRFDMDEKQATMAQDTVLTLNLNLSAIENALQPYLASDKMTLVFNGVDALLSRLLIGNLSHMTDCTFTRGGVQQMLLNICALRQGLTGTLYSYPRTSVSLSSTTSVSSSASRLEHAKRYYQLLNLSETQLEMFLLANRGAYTHEAFRALWHVQAPHRPLSKSSVNKLDSLLRVF